MINRRHRRPSSRHGFTLFEIAISLVIMTFGVVTVMLIIPVGIKVQQTSRMSLLASAKAMELIESFTSRIGGERIAEFETPEPWDTRPFCYSSTRWDFECRTSRFDSGIIPLPLDIAKRLDSDGDEIQTLLASGAYLYYADPKLLPGIDSRYVNKEAPNEAQKMIFAVIGYAQNNAIPVLPWKAWPYRAAYPSPPLYVGLNPGRHMAPELGPTTWSSESASTNPGSDWHSLEGWCNGNPDPSVPRDRDPLMNGVFQAVAKYFWTLKGTDLSFDERTTTANPTIQPVRDVLVKAVIDFCKDKFDNIIAAPSEYTTYYSPPDTTPNYQALAKQYEADFRVKCRAAEQLAGASYDPVKATQRAQLALRVQCMRFMAFLTSTFYLKRQGDAAEPNLSLFKVDNQSLSHDRLRYFQDCCKSSAMLYAASFPYDWGAPRPVSRCIMMDHPLIEFDLFASRSGPIAGTGVMAEMWKPISAQTITSIGLPGIFPGVLTYSAGVTSWDNTKSPFTRDTRAAGHPFWGDANHFTLTRPFQAAERCRQLVFWSVDWQSYEDAETAPGAPLDASRVPCLGMSKNNMNNYNGRLNWGPGAFDGYFLRNPERNLQFIRDMSTVTTGTVLARNQIVGSNGGGDGAIRVLLGIYGADRNHNYILDRGPLPKSVRQRAQTIARFQFYDPRIPVSLR